MSKRNHILFARACGTCLCLETDSQAADNATVDDPDLINWVEYERQDQLRELDPGFYIWEGYFLHEDEGWHVDTMAVRPATTADFFMLGFPLPEGGIA